ncbi:hypothetical protein ACFL9S_18120 [Erwinia sp. AnSW2-5]|uniref:hypothetical protein n=1 Tax=Erwinia sp. AnSW2-5 TaxID=3367692 RepID=UPI003859FC28
MWRKADIAFSDAAALSCSIVAAHPWVYGLGQQTPNGAYLSPVNAVTWLAGKLASMGGDADMTVFMICGDSHDGFMQSLNLLTTVFPAPAFTQVARLAQSSAVLNTVKMQLPAKGINSLPPSLPLSVPTSRAALNAQRTAAAQAEASAGSSLEGLKAQLGQFAAEHASLLDSISGGLEDLKAKSAPAWVYTSRGDVATAAAELLKNIPQPSAIYTVAMMFVGEDLTALGGMIHDIDSHVRP